MPCVRADEIPAAAATRHADPPVCAAGSAEHGAGQQLTVVVGAAGAGKSVLVSSWASARAPDFTAWLSCDEADANPVRFWSRFIEAHRSVMPSFGADAADLLNMDGAVSADVTASIANDAAKLPPRAAVIADDFHFAELQIMYGIGGERDLTERTIDHLSGWRDSKPVRVGNGA